MLLNWVYCVALCFHCLLLSCRDKEFYVDTSRISNPLKIRKIIKRPKSKNNVVLQDGDEIFIAMKPSMTQVLGEVASPGIYKFIPGKRINDYITMAGSYTTNAEKKEIWITYPSGKSKQYNRWLSNPKVKDGSVVTVGLKK